MPALSRTLLVTLLGLFARRNDGWLPVGAIVELLSELGIDRSSIRTAVSRLKQRGWLESERRGGRSGYRLTAVATDALAAGDRVIWHARRPAALADGWCVASFSVPEKDRAVRHLLRSRLAALGFGNLGQGVWIAPARMRAEANELIDGLGLRSYTNVFVGRHEGGQNLVEMVSGCWDLDGIHDRYRGFVVAHRRDVDLGRPGSGVQDGPEAFRRYMAAMDDWRTLPLRDPGLPRELLRSDWAGDEAAALLEEIVAALDESAADHVARIVRGETV
jgi:phenylacetic acid degradation operon negative regulatory protein